MFAIRKKELNKFNEVNVRNNKSFVAPENHKISDFMISSALKMVPQKHQSKNHHDDLVCAEAGRRGVGAGTGRRGRGAEAGTGRRGRGLVAGAHGQGRGG